MHKEFVENAGILWRLDPDLTCHKIDQGFNVSNGLAWSPDNRTLYFADTRRDVVYAYDYDIESGNAPYDQQQKLTLDFYEKRISKLEERVDALKQRGNN